MTNIASWDAPFSCAENNNDALPFMLHEHAFIDIEHIRSEQKRLLPPFQELYNNAIKILETSDPLSKRINARDVVISIHYRLPDYPAFLQEFSHVKSAHLVALVEKDDTPSHPLVQDICPTRPYSVLPVEKRRTLPGLSQFGMVQEEIVNPGANKHVRVVFPEVVDHLLHWLRDVEGTINSFRYSPVATGRSSPWRIGSEYKLG